MFENQQDTVNELLETSKEFRYFYEQHEALDRKVDAVESGQMAMDDLALNEIKKEKLQVKDRLASLLQQATRH
jgi:uncharacterized protein YdcH (DUF465 family)